MDESRSAASSLFKKLSLQYIKEEMVGKEFENNYLECKEKQKPDNPQVDQGDKADFGKALSGFANTSGGVLIFGLKANKREDIDQIVGLSPIANIRQFEARLRELESRIVERVVPKVEYLRLETDANAGILAVFVPESDHLPHRSLINHKFYMRGGGTFYSLDLSIIEDLFYRRRLPVLELFAKPTSQSQLVVYLRNLGPATAKFPYVAFQIPPGFSLSGYELDGNTTLTSCLQVNGYKDLEGQVVLSRQGAAQVVHPDAELPLVELRFNGRMSSGNRFYFNYYVHAEGMASSRKRFEFIMT